VKTLFKRSQLFLALSLLIAPVLFLLRVDAAVINNRTVIVGSAEASRTNVTYDISFTPVTSNPLGSIRLDFCTNSPLFIDPCTPPAGLDINEALSTLNSQSGNTGFTVDVAGSSANTLLLTRPVLAASTVSSDYQLVGITNPSTPNQTTYIRIGLYSTTDGTGAIFDEGGVAFSTTTTFNIGLFVPPYMTFCVAETVAIDCSVLNGSLIDFGELSSTTATTATTQFSVATNDPTGYNTYIQGQTMTSGNNIIQNLTTQSASSTGQNQFGFNLQANTSPSVGTTRDGSGTGVVDAAYNTPNQFRFVNGDRLAGATTSTNFNRYTVSYIVNVLDNQPPGIYASTLTFISVASF
jgi:hypothetical protein